MKPIKNTELADLVTEAEEEIIDDQREEAVRLIRAKLETRDRLKAEFEKAQAVVDRIIAGEWEAIGGEPSATSYTINGNSWVTPSGIVTYAT